MAFLSIQFTAYKTYKIQLLASLVILLVFLTKLQLSNLYIGFLYFIVFKMCCVMHHALLDEPFYLSTLLTYQSNNHFFRSTSFSPLLLHYFNKKSNGFRTFFMLHHFSGIIYLILFALRPFKCHLEEVSKLIYLIKLFLLTLSS